MKQAAAVAYEQVVDPPQARLELLCDAGTFRPHRSAVTDGVLAGAGRVGGRPVYAWAQDPGHMGGSLGPGGGETIARTIAMADRAGAPVVGFLHSGGARLQSGVAALSAYGAIFRAQSIARVPQIAVVCGPCAGGAAYSPALGDLVIMAGDGARMFLTGPAIVERVTRERVSPEELGGAQVHSRNGVAQLEASDDVAAADLVRSLLSHLPSAVGEALPFAPPADPPAGNPARVVPPEHRRVYDMREVIRHVVDAGALLELAPRWARNMVVGLARIEGKPVGVIANQPKHLGGTIDVSAAEKGAWFVNFCDRFGLPLVVLVDTPGFLPGVRQEREGVIRHGASLLRAFGSATVPRVTLITRQAYGGAFIVMNSRDLGSDLCLAWPDASVGVMGARQAVEIVQRRDIADGADPDALAAEYEEQHLPVGHAAAAGFVDEIVQPRDSRDRIAAALGARG